jgi:hypothetical protein
MTWLSEAHKYIASGVLGGVLGSWVTYGLTFPRERRRTRDAYRAPQRQGIGEILTATHALMVCELEKRTVMTELVNKTRQEEDIDPRAMGEELMAAERAMGSAGLSLDRAFGIGTLTIVDAPCWEAMGAAYFEFEQLRSAIQDGATEKQTLEEIEQYIATIASCARQLNKAVSALVRAAQDRVSPAETFCNPWQRRRARKRLGTLYQQLHAADGPDDEPPQPHY